MSEEAYAAVEGGGGEGGWSKAKWEAEWSENFSKDVDEVRRKGEMTITEKDFLLPRGQVPDTTTGSPLFDPDGKEEIDGDSNLQQTPPGIQPFYTAGTAFDPLHLQWATKLFECLVHLHYFLNNLRNTKAKYLNLFLYQSPISCL